MVNPIGLVHLFDFNHQLLANQNNIEPNITIEIDVSGSPTMVILDKPIVDSKEFIIKIVPIRVGIKKAA